MKTGYDLAIIGATGAVGETILEILEQRDFPIRNLYPLASARSAGKPILFKGKPIVVQNVTDFDFTKVQIGLFSAGGEVSAQQVPRATKAGCIAIDNTSQFRYESDVPLIITEVNLQTLADYKTRRIIANPNCSTMQMLVALKPIYDAVGIDRINVATYQAVSGTGKKAVNELILQAGRLLNGKSIKNDVYPKQIAFNVLPQIDIFQENGYTREEMKMVWETQKILQDPTIRVNPTAVRVPVFYGHAEAVHIETCNKITAPQARKLLRNAPGVIVIDKLIPGGYPTPVTHAAGHDEVFVGRIREDISHPLGLNLWVVSDNIRKGAALNAVQIAEALVHQGYV